MNKIIKLAAIDPGKLRDATAFVYADIDEDKIHIRACKRYKGKKYLDMEKDIQKLDLRFEFDYIILEVNAMGEHVYEVLRGEYRLPVIPVNTTNNITDKKKKNSTKTMDKNRTTKQMIQLFEEGKIVFPVTTTKEIDELKRQLSIFSEYVTNAGNSTYKAPGSEHDDYVMALMLIVHLARRFFPRKGSVISVASKKVNYGASDDLFGSAIPAGATLLGRSIYYPGGS